MENIYPQIAPYLSDPFLIKEFLKEHERLSSEELLALVLEKIKKTQGMAQTDLKILANKLEEKRG